MMLQLMLRSMLRSMLRFAPMVALASACTPPRSRPVVQPPAQVDTGYVLPAELSTDRWFLTAKTTTGAPLRIYLDSAGGMFVTKSVVARLGLAVEQETDGDTRMDTVAFPALADAKIPIPKVPHVPVLDDREFPGVDGMFGAPWFAGHAFTFDYPAGRLLLVDHLPDVAPEHRVAVAFQRDDAGSVVAPYGRIQMTVAGETIDMLLDTGATVSLTESARATLGGDAVERATSFITKTVFDRWRAAHPDWRVVEGADKTAGNAPLIEVPKLTVGGYEVGPVWFTWRPDKAFHEWMAQWMDKPTEGALGGNAYRTLRISVDWTAGAATFERPSS